MNEINIIDSKQQTLPIELSYLFARLAPQDVEQFYQCYRLWSLQHDIVTIQGQINELQQQIEHNAQIKQSVQPSSIALSALTQLQAYGVSDLDLLERMHERGDSWLNHTVQLLVRCEELGVIRSNYTQWCENALEGAYDWITSMDQASAEPATCEPFDENMEITLMQKLMSEDDTIHGQPDIEADSTDIADQATLLPTNNAAYPPPETSAQSSIDTTDQREKSPESDIIAESNSSSGTTEAINLEDLKVPTTIQEDELDANQASITSNQSTEAIKQVDTHPNVYSATTETTEGFTKKQRDDTIYQFRSSSKTTDNDTTQHSNLIYCAHDASIDISYENNISAASPSATENATLLPDKDPIYHAHDASADISYENNISAASPTTINNNAPETTNLTANHTGEVSQQENNSEEQTATATTITATNTVTGRTVKGAEQPEQTTESTTTQVHLQEDDLALPPVATLYKPSISWSEAPTITTTPEHPEQTLQATTKEHKSGISRSNESIEQPQTQPKKQGGLLARLFHATK